MAKAFHLTIARVGENLFDGAAESVLLPGTDGVFEVLADNEAFVSPLKVGEARVKAADGKSYHTSYRRAASPKFQAARRPFFSNPRCAQAFIWRWLRPVYCGHEY